ncbi:MAG: hypothetical protein CME59_13655 [Halioglobus sp.]|nr:hypothetical protein [Halioglobus sp.]
MSRKLLLSGLLLLGPGWAQAVPGQPAELRPRINLFPTSVVESLSDTSRAAREMETGLYEIVLKLEKQKDAYESTDCASSDDAGCVQLRKAVRGTYKEMLDLMQASIPGMRASLDATADSMGNSLRSEIGRKMTPGDVQRILGGRGAGETGLARPPSGRAGQGKLSQMFSRYYELVKRGGRQADALPVLASQIYLDSVQSLYFLDLIEAEIGSQSTELVLELEWGELTDQISATVGDVKVLLWGEEDRAQDILEVGLQESASRDEYRDLLIQ